MLRDLVTLGLFVTCVCGQGFMPVPPDEGPCPVFPLVKNFDVRRYLGRWYEIERFFNPFQDGACVTADYSLFANGSVSVLNRELLEGNEKNEAQGVATLASDRDFGQLYVEFPFSSGFDDPNNRKPNYNIVATDYDNYAVVYTCDFFGDLKVEFSWILARRPTIPDSFSRALKEWLQIVNINSKRYIPTRQDGCHNEIF